MTEYRILIADDEGPTNEIIYDRLLGKHDNGLFVKKIAKSPAEFRNELARGYDAILLEVNLDDWGITLKDALADIKTHSPVILVSLHWKEIKTHSRVVDAMASAKNVNFVGTLGLNQLGGDGWEDYAGEMQNQLRLAIAAHRRQGLLNVGEDDEIRILHLSDPQYGDPNVDHWSFLAEDEIAQFVGNELQQYVHFIAITGDITYSGLPKDFVIAEKKLAQLAEAFLPNRDDWSERLLLVPGNHDVNLRLAAADGVTYNFKEDKIENVDDGQTELRRFALQPFRDFAWKLTGDPRWRDAEDLCWNNDSFRHLGLRLYLLSSVATLDCKRPKTAEIPSETLDNLAEKSRPMQTERIFSIALSHHGRELPAATDVEGIKNWEQLSKFLQSAKVKLWLHGHGHQRQPVRCPWGNEEQVVIKSGGSQGTLKTNEILRVMAPTTHLNNNVRPAEEYRGFNIITLYRSHGQVEAIEVDSYEMSEGKPRRAKNAPWSFRL